MKNWRAIRNGPALPVGLALLASLLLSVAAFAVEQNSVVMPPHSVVAGKTLQEWTAVWWQWAYAIPVNDNPLFDQNPTGDKSKFGDVGPVFFLGGVYFPAGSTSTGTISVRRTVTIPANKFIFFPILNLNDDNIGNGCKAPTTSPCVGRLTIDGLRAQIAQYYTILTSTLHASVDFKQIPQLSDHREISPAFSYTLPLTDSLVEKAFGYADTDAVGTVFPAVADGYYLMLSPLSVGRHTINFGGTTRYNGAPPSLTSMDITYDVIVTAAASPQPAVVIP